MKQLFSFPRILFFLISILVLPLLCFSQQSNDSTSLTKRIDSLKTQLSNAKEDTTKVNLLNKLSSLYRFTDSVLAKKYAEDAITLSKKINYQKGMASSYLWLGHLEKDIGNYPQAFCFYEQSLSIAKQTGDKQGMSASYNNIGVIYMAQGNYPLALENHLKSLRIKEELGDKQGIANSHNNIGIIYDSQGNYPLALENHLKSLRITEELGDKKGISASYNNIGNIYYSQGNYPLALENYMKSLRIREEIGDKKGIAYSYNNIGSIYMNQGNYPLALENYLKSLRIKEELGDKQGISASYNNIGITYYEQKNYAEALKNQLLALKIQEEIGDKAGMALSYTNIGNIFTKEKKYSEAKKYLAQGKEAAKEIGYKEYLGDAYSGLSALDSTLRNYQASFEYYKLYSALKDTLNNEQTAKKTGEMEATYQFEKKEIQLTREEEERRRQEAVAVDRRDKIQYAVSLVSILILFGVVFFFGRFQLPPWAVRVAVFVPIVLVFELAIVWLDPVVDVFTKALPLLKFLINCCIGGIIFPIHNFCEKKFKQRLFKRDIGAGVNPAPTILILIGCVLWFSFQTVGTQNFVSLPQNKLLNACKDAMNRVIAFQQKGDWKNARESFKQYDVVKDSLFNSETSMKISRLNQKHKLEKEKIINQNKAEDQARIETQRLNREKNLQYMGILIGLFMIFGILFLLGKFHFPIPNYHLAHWVLELSVFIPVLMLFEFILVWIDPQVDKFIGAAPAYKLMINAILAFLIAPLHNWIERKMKERVFGVRGKSE